MESVSNTVKIHIPNYLAGLPIPKTVGGLLHISVKDWIRLLPFIGSVSFLTWVTYTRFFNRRNGGVNPYIQKESSKVAHCFDIEDLGEKTAFCRCWRSKKFPYCDGSHNDYNTETGDNVGPLVVKR